MMSCSMHSNSKVSPPEARTFYIEEEALDKGLLRIFLPEKTPKNLSIQTPKGEWFVLQDYEESIETMPQIRFESVEIMEFHIEKLKGVTWRNSKKTTDLIFKIPGNYLIYFADNLETEPENTFSLQGVINFKRNTNRDRELLK